MSGEFKRYLFEYRHEGAEWGLEIVASSPQDARERLKALAWAHYEGEIKAKIPVPSGKLFSRIGCWAKRVSDSLSFWQ
jgi:hypothetical protein